MLLILNIFATVAIVSFTTSLFVGVGVHIFEYFDTQGGFPDELLYTILASLFLGVVVGSIISYFTLWS